MPPFRVNAPYQPTGDQPQAIRQLVDGINQGLKHQTLLGATGTGKTAVMAWIVEQVQRPTLVMAHNKTLAAQLYAEFKEFFPDNTICYFVSYYDMYTPEAYVPSKDLYIEKEAQINEEIDRLRHEATQALLSRKDVLIVASVSAIYGLGSPQDYGMVALSLRAGEIRNRDKILRQLIDLQFERNDIDFHRGTFRVRGDTLEIFPANAETAYRVEFWGDEIERMVEVDPLTGELLTEKKAIDIYPAKHFITTGEKLQLAIRDIQAELDERIKELEADGKQLEAQRLKQRTMYDLEMLAEMGYCSGIENYSRHMDRRLEGQTPWTLLDYFPDDFLLFVDESHISVPQIRGMFNGDRSRKQTLVEFGFRLPSALDNRPLKFEEWEQHVHQIVYVSATPGPYEYEHSQQIVEQIIRPTGLLDPVIQVRPTRGQIDDLLGEIKRRVEQSQRALVTTLTKRMAEDLADYLKEMGIRTQYLHADIDTLERVEILRDLRLGVYDVVVGINLLREGLDLPEVSLVAILDADKEGYLRSTSSLIQTIGRAARHVEGTVIMYADNLTRSMDAAIKETQRRREIQMAYNLQHNIEPRGIVKQIRDLTNQIKQVAEEQAPYIVGSGGEIAIPKDELLKMIKELEKQMKDAAKNLEFEKAALLRDQVVEFRRTLALEDTTALLESVNERPGRSRDGDGASATATNANKSSRGGAAPRSRAGGRRK
jgi:excinuclease ABC subunit B